jgi:hypothetical protein
MRKSLVVVVSLSLIAGCSLACAADGPTPADTRQAAVVHSRAELEKMFNDPDLWVENKMRPTMDALSPSERDEIAMIAAERLSLGDIGKGTTAADWKAEFLNLPENAMLRERWSENRHAGELLSYASEKQYITDASVIPYLIDAVDHPDTSCVGNVFGALARLTRHRTGYRGVAQSGKMDDAAEVWWRDWWEANRNKHPVFDLDLEKRTKTEWLRVSTLIESSMAGEFAVFGAYHVGKMETAAVAGDSSPLFDLCYEPCLFANMWWGAGPRPDDNLWISVSAGFCSCDLPESQRGWAREESKPRAVKLPVGTIYNRVLPGTDVAIRVRVATDSEAIVSALTKALQSHGMTDSDIKAADSK